MSLSQLLRAPRWAWAAAAAICIAAAPSAKADLLSLSVRTATQMTNTTINPGITLTGGNGSSAGAGAFLSTASTYSTTTFAGYTIDYRITGSYNPASPSTQTITLEARVRGSATATSTNPALIFTLSGTQLNQPLGSTAFLSSSLSGTNNTAAPVTISTNGTVTNSTTSTTGNASVAMGAVGVFTGTPSAAREVDGGLTPNYSLVNTTTEITFTGAANVTFAASSSVALPEPASIVAGIMGLPCMGAALAFVRRRLGRSTAGADLAA